MKNEDKPIRLTGHTLYQLGRRGTTEIEIAETIRNESWQPAELGRLECRRDFAYDRLWNGNHYGTKQVRPIFVNEAEEIVVVPIYVYSF